MQKEKERRREKQKSEREEEGTSNSKPPLTMKYAGFFSRKQIAGKIPPAHMSTC